MEVRDHDRGPRRWPAPAIAGGAAGAVIAAVLELAAEGGYEAIQVRAIAERTGISSDTIYRYFGSRDRLIAEAVGQWSDREFYEPAPTWLEGETPAEQLLSLPPPDLGGVGDQSTHARDVRAGGPARGRRARRDRRHRVSSLVPVTEYALRDVEPAYRDDASMAVAALHALGDDVRGARSDVGRRRVPGARAPRATTRAAPGHGRPPAPVVGLGPRRAGVAGSSGVLDITRIMGVADDR